MSLCGVFKATAQQRYEDRKKYHMETEREIMGGNARTTEFLKECLSDSLIKLMRTKRVDQINIAEITKMASVGRTTYFRNFKAKNELISFKLIKLWERWAEQNELEIRDDFSLTNASAFFFFNYSIRELLTLIYQRERQTAVYDAFQTVLYPKHDADPAACYKGKFYAYALFGLLDEWIQRGFLETPEEMIRISGSISIPVYR